MVEENSRGRSSQDSQAIDDGCCEGAGGQEQDRTAVVAGCDAAPVLQACDHALDAVAQAVEVCVVRDLELPATARGDARSSPHLGQGV